MMAFPKKDPNLQPLPVGTPAPNFSLPASGVPEGQLVSLKDYAGKPFVLVFYPKDKTPGCTQQLCDLTTDFSQFQALNCAVLASNSGSLKSHESFAEKYGYCFPILVDAEKTMAAAYSVLKAEGGYQRTVYVVDGAGVIRFAQQGMAKHADLLACLQSL
ncbi:MAG: peroxiredoxin [Candidatus Melainabacteria bacterium]|nr:peroxiredoxin [Candidatus Melainabacteria bacterium]